MEDQRHVLAHPPAEDEGGDRHARYLPRHRDRIYGPAFRERVTGLGLEEILTAPRSPWHSPHVERLIGTIRRECLANVVVLGERHLRRVLGDYLVHYHRWR